MLLIEFDFFLIIIVRKFLYLIKIVQKFVLQIKLSQKLIFNKIFQKMFFKINSFSLIEMRLKVFFRNRGFKSFVIMRIG